MIIKQTDLLKLIFFGNSGSGKTTLAKEYVKKYKLSHLDLDTIAWEDTTPALENHERTVLSRLVNLLEEIKAGLLKVVIHVY